MNENIGNFTRELQTSKNPNGILEPEYKCTKIIETELY